MRLVTTPHGSQFWVYNSDGIGREVEKTGYWEPHIYKYFEDPSCGKGFGWGQALRALEVGANIGVHTRALAGIYREVIAVEPLTALALRANTVHLGNVEVHEVAGYSRQTQMVYAGVQQTTAWQDQERCPNVGAVALVELDPHRTYISQGPLLKVQALPLDLIVGLRWIDFIKIDAQGCDYAVLQGLEETIKRCRPRILSEYEPDLAKLHGVTPEVYRKWFADHDYVEGPVDGDRVNSWGVPREKLREGEKVNV